jgi:hypothetical protein
MGRIRTIPLSLAGVCLVIFAIYGITPIFPERLSMREVEHK